jgi:TatA/E family protein of Tat protein translocase
MFGLGMGEILIILVAALIFIGPKKLPQVARTRGKALGEFQNATKGITSSLKEPMEHTVEEVKKDLPLDPEQFKDDPPHDKGEAE